MESEQNFDREPQMLEISKALQRKVQTALEQAVDREKMIPIEGLGIAIFPQEAQPNDGFDPIGYITREDGRVYAYGLFKGE